MHTPLNPWYQSHQPSSDGYEQRMPSGYPPDRGMRQQGYPQGAYEQVFNTPNGPITVVMVNTQQGPMYMDMHNQWRPIDELMSMINRHNIPASRPVMQQPMGYRAPNQQFGNDNSGFGFGQRAPSNEFATSGGSIDRPAKKRVVTAGGNHRYDRPETVVEKPRPHRPNIVHRHNQVIPEVPNGPIPLTEPGIIAIPVGCESDNIIYHYEGVSTMEKFETKQLAGGNEPEVPVPDHNLIGDAVYAGMLAALYSNGHHVVHQTIDAEYSYYNREGSKFSIPKTGGFAKFVTALQKGVASGSLAAKAIDARLTMMTNALSNDVIGTGLTIDSFCEDITDLAGFMAGDSGVKTGSNYNAINAVLDKVVSKITAAYALVEEASDDEKPKYDKHIERVYIPETYIVIHHEDVSATCLDNDDVTSCFITPESAPAIYTAVADICGSVEGITYLLTDKHKYMVCGSENCDKLAITRMP